MNKIYLIIVCLFLIKLDVHSQGHIIPEPVATTWHEGYFLITPQTTIITNDDKEQRDLGTLLNSYLKQSTGYSLKKANTNRHSKSIRLLINKKSDTSIGDEGYHLTVASNTVYIKANKPAGLFYGIQTLVQLLPVQSMSLAAHNEPYKIPAVTITDYPRFKWRGLMLDVCRHFFTVQDVKKLIDEMVRYKYNLLHLHLSDDQGWRIEIKSLPELTKTGAWRVPRTGLWWDRQPPQPGEKATEGGFYTQDQIKDIIRYASEKNVQVMPEIDVPGHSLAAIASYPYLSCTKMNYGVNPGSKFYGVDDDALCAGNDSTYAFLEKVFTEIAALFPFEYIHVGGDECYKGFWKNCPVCQHCMQVNGLKNEEELQSYFIKRVEKILQSKGKKLMGWDEILEGGLPPDASVMSWRGMQGGIEAVKQKHHVVMSPAKYCYFDLYQGDPAAEPPTYSMLRLKDVYSFEPVPTGIDANYILGGQGNLWTESVPTFRHAEYMLWPRAVALSEVLWSPKDKLNWNGFVNKLEIHLRLFDIAGINYAKSFYDAIIIPSETTDSSLQLQFDTEIKGLQIYYTFDNTFPDQFSTLYKKTDGKIGIPKDAETLRVITFRQGKPIGKMITVPLADLEKRIKKK
ncbi:MAG: family 20 glycosylhydrolase [Bacteroidota bacterium]|nr:family 20 glycosylhydrolase [Bacteroidota bacterium]